MRTSFLYLLYFILVNSAAAQEHKRLYQTASIPEALLKNAHAVVRLKEEDIRVESIQKSIFKKHEIIAILDEEGKQEASFYQATDAFSKLKSFDLKVFNVSGGLLQSYTKSNLSSEGGGDGLVADYLLYYLQVAIPYYPATVEISYELERANPFQFPPFRGGANGVSEESAVFIFECPKNYAFHSKIKSGTLHFLADSAGKTKTFTWTSAATPLPPFEKGSNHSHFSYELDLAPDYFMFDGKQGSLLSWKSFGTWYYDVLKTCRDFNEPVKEQISARAAQAADAKGKAEIVYKYLQKNFRYVSIQLGIGGLKPFPVAFTDSKRYGDCKALSLYMQGCLEAIGIKSYLAIINSGYNKDAVAADFPEFAFDHVILCSIIQADTVWLECTSRTNPFGVLGSFTENRKALLITENGGVLVNTPKSKSGDNVFHTSCSVMLHPDGSADIESLVKGCGEYSSFLNSEFASGTESELRYFIRHGLDYRAPSSFKTEKLSAGSDILSAHKLLLKYEKYCDFKAGEKLFFPSRPYQLLSYDMPACGERTLPYYFHYPYRQTDSTTIHIPEGYILSGFPLDTLLQSAFGKYSRTSKIDNSKHTVAVITCLELFEARIPATGYCELKNFCLAIEEGEKKKMVLDLAK
jgi:hypothetical protein